MGIGRSGSRFTAFISPLRLVRVLVRLARLALDRELTEFFLEKTRNEHMVLIGSIVKYISVMMGFSHLTACAWYGVGAFDWEYRYSWVTANDLVEKGVAEKYVW